MSAVTWVAASHGEAPEGAVCCGEGNEGVEYIGRAHHDNGVLVGKVVPDHGVCYVAYCGEEFGKEEYEVLLLTGEGEVEWVAASGTDIPPNAIKAGYLCSGHDLYIARAWHEDKQIVGHLNAVHGLCCCPYGGKECTYCDYEVLCQK